MEEETCTSSAFLINSVSKVHKSLKPPVVSLSHVAGFHTCECMLLLLLLYSLYHISYIIFGKKTKIKKSFYKDRCTQFKKFKLSIYQIWL